MQDLLVVLAHAFAVDGVPEKWSIIEDELARLDEYTDYLHAQFDSIIDLLKESPLNAPDARVDQDIKQIADCVENAYAAFGIYFRDDPEGLYIGVS